MYKLPNVGFFGTGGEKYGEGGSGIEKILEVFGGLEIKDAVKVIVSDNWNGGVREKAYKNAIPFEKFQYFPKRGDNGEFSDEDLKYIKGIYQEIVKKYDLEYVFMSGWLKYIIGLIPNKTVNIHPGPTQKPYGGKGMYGDNVHKKVWADYVDGTINQTCVTMHYVNEKFDDGPIIIQQPVGLVGCNSWEDVKERVNKIEHIIQWKITKMVMTGEISWSGIVGEPIQFPEGFLYGKELDLKGGIPYKKEEN